MRDIQNEIDTRDIPLQKVGVKGVKYPVLVLARVNKTQTTTATADLFVNLPHHFKGKQKKSRLYLSILLQHN